MGSYLAIGEFSLRIVPTIDGGEGIRVVFGVRKKYSTHIRVYEASKTTVHVEITAIRTPCMSIAKTIQKKLGGKNERITKDQN